MSENRESAGTCPWCGCDIAVELLKTTLTARGPEEEWKLVHPFGEKEPWNMCLGRNVNFQWFHTKNEAITALTRGADGWVSANTPPVPDKPYLVTDGDVVIRAKYTSVPYPLGDYMEWVALGCIVFARVLHNVTHYREIELPMPPREG